jgi:DNA processing protein
LIQQYGSPDAALEDLPRRTQGRLSPAPREAIELELDALERIGARLIASCEPDYPANLAALAPGPAIISVRGRVEMLTKPLVAIVGAREASAAGLKLAADFALGLGSLGFVTVSGMARGIDGRVHEASLKTGTIAVLAGGLDRPYPPQNLALFERLCAEGLVVTEAPLSVQARTRDFPRRNHIISGLSLGVVVIEAAVRSGSLITARAAAEQGREVMAAPASPLYPRGRGCNALIRGGATLVDTPEDVAEALNAAPARLQPHFVAPFSEQHPVDAGLTVRLARLLSPTPVHVNDLARLLETQAGAVAAALTELELEGAAASLPGGYAASSVAAFPTS